MNKCTAVIIDGSLYSFQMSPDAAPVLVTDNPIYSFIKYQSRASNVPGTVLGTVDTALVRKQNLYPLAAYFLLELTEEMKLLPPWSSRSSQSKGHVRDSSFLGVRHHFSYLYNGHITVCPHPRSEHLINC